MSSIVRKSPRLDFSALPLLFQLSLKTTMDQDSPTRMEARNISRHGMKFYSNRKIPLFEQTQISLFEKKTGKLVAEITSKVVRLEEIDIGVGERTYGISVEFIAGADPLGNFIPEEYSDPSKLEV
jgi:hypothetical protein